MATLTTAEEKFLKEFNLIKANFNIGVLIEDDAKKEIGKAITNFSLEQTLQPERLVIILEALLKMKFYKESKKIFKKEKYSFLAIVENKIGILQDKFNEKASRMDRNLLMAFKDHIMKKQPESPLFPPFLPPYENNCSHGQEKSVASAPPLEASATSTIRRMTQREQERQQLSREQNSLFTAQKIERQAAMGDFVAVVSQGIIADTEDNTTELVLTNGVQVTLNERQQALQQAAADAAAANKKASAVRFNNLVQS